MSDRKGAKALKVAVVSLNFSPGHIAHLRAYKKLFETLCEDVKLFLDPDYKSFLDEQEAVSYTKSIDDIVDADPDLVFVYNVSVNSILLADKCRKKSIKMIYVLHEPLGSFKKLLRERSVAIRVIGAAIVSAQICKRCDKVLLASENGLRLYEQHMKKYNTNYDIFPLIFCDEYNSEKKYVRKYFSFIGGFTESHAGRRFMNFVKYAIEHYPDICFLIATKTDIAPYMNEQVIQKAIKEGRIVVQSGRPMSSEEVNGFYRQSICVWNAYNRNTQSGVLANAMMQGAPVIVNQYVAVKKSIIDRNAGFVIDVSADNTFIYEAYCYIREHLAEMEANARDIFLSTYFYERFLDLAKNVILT